MAEFEKDQITPEAVEQETKELVKENEDALVSKLDPSDLSEKIKTLLRDKTLCEKIGQNAAKKFVESDESIKELLSLI